MKVLALDTTGERGSLALVDKIGVLAECELVSSDGFAHVVFSEIKVLLDRAGISLEEIDLFAAASGPGSFTGVRVGLSAMKGLAHALGKKAVAVSNLEALASLGRMADEVLRVPLIDARRGQVYGSVYDVGLGVILPEAVMPLASWLKSLTETAGEIPFGFLVQSSGLGAELPGAYQLVAGPLAPAIGRIALHRAEIGRSLDPADLDANYVRRSDAELFWKDPAAR